jgi:DNA polymerase delta subunit 2
MVDQECWVAIVSGLEVGLPSPADARLQMLAEYLTSECGGDEEQLTSSKISRVIIAGNTFAAASDAPASTSESETEKKAVRDSAIVFS